MQSSVTRLVLIIFAVTLMVAGTRVAVAIAQEEASNNAVVHSGNTYIIFKNASNSDLPSARYQAFDQFAAENPQIVKQLAHNPRLIEDESFIRHHPALADFLRTHSDMASDFAENPGNYVDMPLAVAASLKRHPIER